MGHEIRNETFLVEIKKKSCGKSSEKFPFLSCNEYLSRIKIKLY